MNKVEAIAHNDERKLLRELGLLEEVLDLLCVIEVFLSKTLALLDLEMKWFRLKVQKEVSRGTLKEKRGKERNNVLLSRQTRSTSLS